MRKAAALAGIWIAALVVGTAVGAGDWEHWAGVDIAGALADGLTIRIAPEVRSREDFTTHYEGHFDTGIEWKVRKWLAVGPYYRHATQMKGESWQVEHRPHMDITLSWKFLGLRLGDRSRLAYRIIDKNESLRYRNRLMARFPERTPGGLRPYVGEEIFYDFDLGEINKNRLAVGFDFAVSTTTRLDISYLLESAKKSDHWSSANVLKTTLIIRP
ncbi:MAG: DUF2490 domain-containing protein [Candidatus Eisenbacteria bacterium]